MSNWAEVLDMIFRIFPIIISIYSVYISKSTGKRQKEAERKSKAPCIILYKDELLLRDEYKFTDIVESKIFAKKSVSILSNLLEDSNSKKELDNLLVLNYSDEDKVIGTITEDCYQRFFNHAIITIKNVGFQLVAIKMLEVEIIFDEENKEKRVEKLVPQKGNAEYNGFLDNGQELKIYLTYLFNKKDGYFDLNAIPESDIETIRDNCDNRNILNKYFSKVTDIFRQLIFHFELTNQYNEHYKQKIVLDSHNNTYTTWIEIDE